MKSWKKILLFVLAIAILCTCVTYGIIFLGFYSGGRRFYKEWRQTFSSYKSDFETVNEYLLSVLSENAEASFLVVYGDNDEDISLYTHLGDDTDGFYILPEEQVKVAVNNINNVVQGRFDYITVTDERISYGSLSGTWYIYSRTSEKIKKHDPPNNGKHYYRFCNLNDDWYLFYSVGR